MDTGRGALVRSVRRQAKTLYFRQKLIRLMSEPVHPRSNIGGLVCSVRSGSVSCKQASLGERVMLAITEANVSKFDDSPWRSEHDRADRQCSTKILVVDNHFLIREALRGSLKTLKSDAMVF